MQDAIIKGNGNSRYLKTVAAALSLYPTYEDFLRALVAGNFPIDLNGINEAGWTQQGTPLNKANLLPDTLATSLGLPTTATVADALDKLRTVTDNISVNLESQGWHKLRSLAVNVTLTAAGTKDTAIINAEELDFSIISKILVYVPDAKMSATRTNRVSAGSVGIFGATFELIGGFGSSECSFPIYQVATFGNSLTSPGGGGDPANYVLNYTRDGLDGKAALETVSLSDFRNKLSLPVRVSMSSYASRVSFSGTVHVYVKYKEGGLD